MFVDSLNAVEGKETVSLAADAEILSQSVELCPFPAAGFFKQPDQISLPNSGHTGDSRPHDADFLPRNVFQARPQIILVIPADVGNDTDDRVGQIGRIQTPSQTDFQYGEIHPLPVEMMEGDRREKFEVGNFTGYVVPDCLDFGIHFLR